MKDFILNLKDRFTVEKHELVMVDNDLLHVLKNVTIKCDIKHMDVECYGWRDVDKQHVWAVSFRTTRTKWKKLKGELRVVRIWDISDIPSEEDAIVRVYSTD